MKKYKVVRTYSDEDKKVEHLQSAFDEGWKFVRASEFIVTHTHTTRQYGYIEYILSKEVED